MKWSKLKEETIENIKAFSISGILVVAFYTLINNVEPLYDMFRAIFVALSPFIYGLAIAFLLNPLRKIIEYSWLEKTSLKQRTKKIIASFGALFIGIIMLFVFFSILIPQMISSIQTFLSSFEGYVDTVRNFFDSNNFLSEDLLKTLNPVIDKGASMLGDWVSNLASSLNAILMYSVIFAKGVMNFLIGMIIALYILLDEPKLKRQTKKVLYALLPKKTTEKIIKTSRLTINTFNSFIAGKAVAFGEAIDQKFEIYSKQVITNAKALAKGMIDRGFQIVSGGTDNHLMLIDLRNKGVNGKETEKALVKADITCNKNMVPFDDKSAFTTSGIRLGTAAITTRGLKETDMDTIADLISTVVDNINNETIISEIRAKVNQLMDGRELFYY